MTQYTKFTKNPLSENYATTHSNIKISQSNNNNENKSSNSPSAINSSPTSKMVNSSVNIDPIGVHLNGNNTKMSSSTNQNVFSKPLFISNFNSATNNYPITYPINKNERVKSTSILRSNTVKYSRNIFENSLNQNQQSSFNYLNSGQLSSKNLDINLNDINGNESTPRQIKKNYKTSSLNPQNFSIDGSKREFLTVLSNIHRTSSINLAKEKTNLSSYFSTSPNIYAKNYSTESVNSINNINSINQREKNPNMNNNLKNSESSLNLSSFSNNFQNLKYANRRHQTVSFRNSINNNIKAYNSTEGHSVNNLNGNTQNINGIEIKTNGSKIGESNIVKNFEDNNLFLNEIQFSPKFVLSQSDANRVNNMKIYENINLNFINNKKNSNAQSKKLGLKNEDVETLNNNTNIIAFNEDLAEKTKSCDQTEDNLKTNKNENLNELEDDNKKDSKFNSINSKDSKERKLNINEAIKREVYDRYDKILNDEEEDEYSTSKIPSGEKLNSSNNLNKKDSFPNNAKVIINNPVKKISFNDEHTELIGLNLNNNNNNNNNAYQKINKLEINMDKFEPIKKQNYFNQIRQENHSNKNKFNNNRQFISSVVQSIANNPSATVINQNSNYRMNKNSLDFILIPQQSSIGINNISETSVKLNEGINNRQKLIRSNSKISYISRDINDSYAYTNVQQYIEENDLMPSEKYQSINKWIKDVNIWCDDWEKRTIELNIEEN